MPKSSTAGLVSAVAALLFAFLAPAAAAFNLAEDIPSDDPYFEPLYACQALGLLDAGASGSFRLEESLDRYQVAHIVVQALLVLGVELPANPAPVKWPDVPGGHWAYRDIAICVDLGLMAGYDDLSFRGRSSMQKEHWLAMASNLARKFAPEPAPEEQQVVPIFRDLPDLNWLWTPIRELARYGWLDPETTEDDFLNRNDIVTRRLLYWYLGKLALSRKGPLGTWAAAESGGPEVT
jgi:hypothetical protein